MFYGLDKDKAERFLRAVQTIGETYPRHFLGDNLIALDRNMGFYEDARFMQAFKAVVTPKTHEPSLIWRLHVLAWAADHCLRLPGDFVECGVFKGFSTAVLAQYLDFAKLPQRWFLYDTFSGVPERQLNSDDENPAAYLDPQLHAFVLERFAAYPNIRVIRGQVPEILETEAPDSVSYLHIDMNSADAELGALEQLFHRVVPGGLVVLDDYGWHQYREQKYVEDAFFGRVGYRVLELPTGQGLVVKR